MTEELDDVDRTLLSYLSRSGNMRLSELVNENRDHDLPPAQVRERLDRLAQLGYIEPAYWVITPVGTAAAPSFLDRLERATA